MSVWVVVGGQYGSEGKGKIAAFITQQEKIDICVRCGGPNSGHCFVDMSGRRHVLRQVPTGFIRPATRLLIPSGGLIDINVLAEEVQGIGLTPERFGIDSAAMLIEEEDRQKELESGLRERLSSTLCGVGAAVARRALRAKNVRLARDAAEQVHWLRPYLVDVSRELNLAVDRGKKVLIEGTQGFGLSLLHSGNYPKTTSRDTSAAGMVSECGISPLLVTNVVLVLRTFPIRVAGQQAGSMFAEVDWETVRRESGYPSELAEHTTVTGKLRRVARFDWDLARRAIAVNRPTALAVNFLDYLGYSNLGVNYAEDLTSEAKNFLARLAAELKVPVRYLGTGPGMLDTFQQFAPIETLAHA